MCKGFEDSVLSQKSRFWKVGERGRTEKKKKRMSKGKRECHHLRITEQLSPHTYTYVPSLTLG